MNSKKRVPLEEAQKIVTAISDQYDLTTFKKWMQFMGRELRDGRKSVLSFEEAREFARSLNLKSVKAWKDYCIKIECPPNNIPSRPADSYKNKGWVSWNDFLSAKPKIPSQFCDYKTARRFVRNLKPKINNCKEWDEYCKSGRKSRNIPHSPQKIYTGHGWIGWDEFFGAGNYTSDMTVEQLKWDISWGVSMIGEAMECLRGDMTDDEILEAYKQEATDIIDAVKEYMKKYPREEE